MNPKISVVMSVYNGARHLREAIDSVLNQTFSNFEFIIVNDASTDRSRDIVLSYSDPRIVLIENERNEGITRSLNKGLRAAQGLFIARQDADDISEPQRLEVEVDFLERFPDVGLVGTHAAFIDRKGRVFGTWETPATHEEIVKGMQYGNCFCHGSVMVRKRCLDTVGFYREAFKYAQDYDLWLLVSEQYRTANISMPLYRMRRSPDTISRSRHSEQLDFHLLAIELAKERRRTGVDSLAALRNERITAVLQSRYKVSGATIQRFKSEMFLVKFSESLQSGDYRNAIGFWAAAFLMEPRLWKLRILIRRLYRSLTAAARCDASMPKLFTRRQ